MKASRDTIAEQQAVDAAFLEQQRWFLDRAAELEAGDFEREDAEGWALRPLLESLAPPPQSWQEELCIIVEEDLRAEGTSA
jgi:hypothetical protein